MAAPGQNRGTCGHIMALFSSHSKCARCHEKGSGSDSSVEKKPCEICDMFSSEQKKQLATPNYRIRKEHQQKKTSSTPILLIQLTLLYCGRLRAKVIVVIEAKPHP